MWRQNQASLRRRHRIAEVRNFGRTPDRLLAGEKNQINFCCPGGSLALLQRKGGNVNLYDGLSVLKGKTIGVVRGYQNTPEFDAMMDARAFSVVEAVDELQLINLLVSERVAQLVSKLWMDVAYFYTGQ